MDTTSSSISAFNTVYIDASRSSSIYGNSKTVQPLNTTIKLWQRIS